MTVTRVSDETIRLNVERWRKQQEDRRYHGASESEIYRKAVEQGRNLIRETQGERQYRITRARTGYLLGRLWARNKRECLNMCHERGWYHVRIRRVR